MTIARYFNPRLRARILAGEQIPWLEKHIRKGYIVRCVLATVPWADLAKMRALRDEAKRLTAETGIRHVLDHDIPLTHKYVCGLNVHNNLVVMPWKANAAKGNRWTPDQLELELP